MKSKLLYIILFFKVVYLNAQISGGIDVSFSTTGKNTTDFTGNDIAYATAIQSDGKIVSVGKTGNNVALTRHQQNGLLDNTFSGDGKQETNLSTTSTAYGVAIQSDNKIVVVGTTHLFLSSDDDFFILRYNIDGTLDNTFSGDGKLVEDDTDDDIFYGVSIQPDGKIVCIGQRKTLNGSQFVVRRYNSNGTVDASFYGSSFGTINYPLGYARAIVQQPDGKIVVVGDSYASPAATFEDYVTIRLNTDGTLDNSFDTDGIVTTAVSVYYDIAGGVALQPNGKIVLAGSSKGVGLDISLVRYNQDGSLDTSFSGDGKLMTDINVAGDDIGKSISLQPDGTIVVAGSTLTAAFSYIDLQNITHNVAANSDFLILNYTPNGNLDNNFSSDGIVKVVFGEGLNDFGYGMFLQNDGKITVVGSANNGTNNDFAICRLHGNYGFFTLENKVYTKFSDYGDFAKSMALQTDGKIVVAGTSYNDDEYDLAIVRYLKNGILDNTFSNDGKQILSFGSNSFHVTSVAIQSDGKILVAGKVALSLASDFMIVRLLPNGNLDNTFGVAGKLQISIKTYDDLIEMVIRTDGKIILVGDSYEDPNNFISLVRLNADGSYDTSFDTDGLATILYNDAHSSLSVSQYNNTIYIGGVNSVDGTSPINPNPPAMVRSFLAIKITENGMFDTSFGGTGVVITSLSENIYTGSIVVQSDGKVLLGGNTNETIEVVRYNPDGSLDNTFATNGRASIEIGQPQYLSKIKIQPNGQIVISARSATSIVLTRLNSNGGTDKTFGTGGYYFQTLMAYSTYDFIQDMQISPTNKIYLAGSYDNGYIYNFALSVFTQCKTPAIALSNSYLDEISTVLHSPYYAQSISAENQILNLAKAEYNAAKSILLNPGFKVEQNAVFTAKIEDFCSYTSDQ